MKSYSIVFTAAVLVIICNVNINNVKANPFGLLKSFSGSTQNAQNSITQGERNRSLEFVKTVLVTPLYGPGISYKVGLLGRLFRQFSQIADNRPGNAANGGRLPNSISKTLHFNRGITVTSPTENDATITHATMSTTEMASAAIDDDKEPSKTADMEEKELDIDLGKDEEKDAVKDDDKDSEKDDDKDSEKDSDKDSEKEDDKDSEKDDNKDSDKDENAISDDDKDSDKDSEKEIDKDIPNIALIDIPIIPPANRTISSPILSTNTRSDIVDTKKVTNGSNDKIAESSLNSLTLTPQAINSLQTDAGKNLTGSGGYHYSPRGYRYTRNGPTFIFEPSEIINTLAG